MNTTLSAINSTIFKPANRFDSLLVFAMDYVKLHKEFTTEQMRAAYSETMQIQPVEQRAWGAVIMQLRKFKMIKAVGITKSQNKQAHSRPIYIWGVNF